MPPPLTPAVATGAGASLGDCGPPFNVAFTGSPGDLQLAHFNVHCPGEGQFKVVATANPPSPFGAIFFDVGNPGGNIIPVTKVRDQGGVDVADSLLINCIFQDPTLDSDHDGCRDVTEQQPKANANTGGGRNPSHFWDVFDTETENGLNAGTTLAGTVTISDIFTVVGHFGDTGDPGIDPLSDASGAGYHTRFDRGDLIGPHNWNRAPADGAVTIEDIVAVASQFGLNCS